MSEHRIDPRDEMKRISRRSFLWAAGAVGMGYGGWHWLSTRHQENGIPWVFRRAHEFNESLSMDLFDPKKLAPTFPVSLAEMPRENGDVGVQGDDFDPEQWTLNVEGLFERTEPLVVTMAQILAMPKTEMVTEMKCVEGWSTIVHWAGVRLSDFAAVVKPATVSGEAPNVAKKPEDILPYVAMETPDGAYYVGLDTASALHPQTLLCYEMDGKRLTLEHGAPLRLVIPVKYGIKHIKRIGTIRFATERPKDYWAEQGYDWFAGH